MAQQMHASGATPPMTAAEARARQSRSDRDGLPLRAADLSSVPLPPIQPTQSPSRSPSRPPLRAGGVTTRRKAAGSVVQRSRSGTKSADGGNRASGVSGGGDASSSAGVLRGSRSGGRMDHRNEDDMTAGLRLSAGSIGSVAGELRGGELERVRGRVADLGAAIETSQVELVLSALLKGVDARLIRMCGRVIVEEKPLEGSGKTVGRIGMVDELDCPPLSEFRSNVFHKNNTCLASRWSSPLFFAGGMVKFPDLCSSPLVLCWQRNLSSRCKAKRARKHGDGSID